jgi:hypothetical protein
MFKRFQRFNMLQRFNGFKPIEPIKLIKLLEQSLKPFEKNITNFAPYGFDSTTKR